MKILFSCIPITCKMYGTYYYSTFLYYELLSSCVLSVTRYVQFKKMVICTFTNLNTNACDQKKLMLMIVLSYLGITHYQYQFCFYDMYFTLSNLF